MAAECIKKDNKGHQKSLVKYRFWNIMEPYHKPLQTTTNINNKNNNDWLSLLSTTAADECATNTEIIETKKSSSSLLITEQEQQNNNNNNNNLLLLLSSTLRKLPSILSLTSLSTETVNTEIVVTPSLTCKNNNNKNININFNYKNDKERSDGSSDGNVIKCGAKIDDTWMNTTNVSSVSSFVETPSPQPLSASTEVAAVTKTKLGNNIYYNKNNLGIKCSKTLWQLMQLIVIYLLLSISTSKCLAARQEASPGCTFPQRWEGSWFQSGQQQPIFIKGSILSFRGKCLASDGDKFLLVDEKGCHRCVVIYEKHKNVLQYKESECEDMYQMDQSNPAAMPIQQMRILKSDHTRGGAHPNTNGHSRLSSSSSSDPYLMRSSNDDSDNSFCNYRLQTLSNLCEQIPGDALLFSMFKENAEPVKCPLKGPFTFTYNRGHGECKSPVSNIESCTEDSRLLLSFQACPDVTGTESTVEELTCLATWKDGNARYLVGLVTHHHATSNEERYRCFVYEKISSGMGGSTKDAEYKLAQSGDATCNGLDSAEVGSRIMTLRKAPPADRCDFPPWFKGPRHWHALMGNAGYTFHQSDGSMHIIKPSGSMETRALCEQINKQTSTEMMAVVHYTTGCQSGFMCMMFYRRDTHVAEIQTGSPASRLEDACAPDHFDINKLPYITLLASYPESQECPLGGSYGLRGPIGPPYVASRHKRNHSNKGHNIHGHHHHEVGHRRHSTLSFRNSDDFERNTLHSHSRGLTLRNRRSANDDSNHINNKNNDGVTDTTSKTIDENNENNDKEYIKRNYRKKRSSTLTPLMAIQNITTTTIPTTTASAESSTSDKTITKLANNDVVQPTDIILNTIINDTQRNRRQAPGCFVNYNAQRQLMIGCSEPNVIEVRPQCTDDSDEVYTCHGSWTENQTVFIIGKHSGSQHGVCISYRPLDGGGGNVAQLIVGDACYRGVLKPPEHHLVANLTTTGTCSDTNSSNLPTNHWILICIIAWIITILSNSR